MIKKHISELDELVEIIKTIKLKITEETNLVYSGFSDFKELQNTIDSTLIEIIEGDTDKLSVFEGYLAPTAAFQEISMANGWSDEYMHLSQRFDQLYLRIKNRKSNL